MLHRTVSSVGASSIVSEYYILTSNTDIVLQALRVYTRVCLLAVNLVCITFYSMIAAAAAAAAAIVYYYYQYY